MNDQAKPGNAAAVALKYDGDSAPRIVAKGEGLIAEKIIDIAREHGITLYKDSELVKLLVRLDLEQEIPANLYQAVAAVLAFVYRINGQVGMLSGNQAVTSSPFVGADNRDKDKSKIDGTDANQ